MKYILSILSFIYFIDSVSAQQSMFDFGKSELDSALEKIQSHNKTSFDFFLDNRLGVQSYCITLKEKEKITITAGDSAGLMYACLELAERIRLNGKIDAAFPIKGEPFIKRRGLKFNIPLDIRTPSYQDAGDAAQKNILEMWNFDFWRQYLDMMARNRYNVLTLWNPNPFPSMVKMKNYSDINLENVCGTSFPLDVDRQDEPTAKFIAGCGISDSVMNNLIVLKKISLDDKIVFWKDVMRYAKARGVKVYFITWSIWMNSIAPTGWYRNQENKKGNQGKYGINNDQENPRTIAYLREAVKEFVLTYPDLAGIGVTAGENMEDRSDEFDREKWLWATYGEGILDAKKIQPERKIEFIHRYWQSGVEKIVTDFISKYPDEINLSFKYAKARMYATPTPKWANGYITEIKGNGLKSWWNIRNDDIFHFRWGDAVFASSFIKNIPSEDVTAGYFMGSDSYVWGREFISKHPTFPRQLEIDKHWYNFMLWGRLGYNPDLDNLPIRLMLAERYPGVDPIQLEKAWASASAIPSLVTRFHWHDWDFMWAVEGCLDLRKGFHTVKDFINKLPMEGSGMVGIKDAIVAKKNSRIVDGVSPLQVATQLDSLSSQAIIYLKNITGRNDSMSNEYLELLYDIEAFSYMGKYYAQKIRGAYYLHSYLELKINADKLRAADALKEGIEYWNMYAKAASRNYYPQFLSKTRTIDWNKLAGEVENEWLSIEKLKN